MMAITIWSGWDKNEVAREGRSEPGTAVVVLDGVMVIWSSLGGFDWSMVGLERWMIAGTGWDRCRVAG